MRILVVHNYYQQPGGEDRCLDSEIAMLRDRGHEVIRFTADNDEIDGMGRLALAARTVWSRPTYKDLRALIRSRQPQVVHFHNTFPLISPAAYYAAKAEGVPVVQTLHNFRLLCPNALFFRDGQVCEDCLGKSIPWPGVMHKCYRGNRSATAAVATMVTAHRALGTWRDMVDVYIPLTEASRSKFVAGGLPADRLVVKPNFLEFDPGIGDGSGGYAIFVGRLSAEKGIETLLKAWKTFGHDLPLKIVGDGPLAQTVSAAASANPAVEWLKSQSPQEVLRLIGGAKCVILPSECYENFPRVAIEAFSKGTPVIASRLGAMAEVVADGRTGLRFAPGDPNDLAATVRRFLSHTCMRASARAEFDQKYTAEANYQMLTAIYERAEKNARRGFAGQTPSTDGTLNGHHAARPPQNWPRKVDLFGVDVSVTDYASATAAVIAAAKRRESAVVTCHAVHAIVTASRDPNLRDKVNTFELVTPDGQPVRWALNLLHRTKLTDRVYGPELMLRLCRAAAEQNVPIYLYGGNPAVAERLQANLLKECPGLQIAGYEAPPFRPLTPEEDREVVERINNSGAGLVFIGLGCPKQDFFAAEHRDAIKAVQLCVGAAFDFHAGVKKVAPAWMQKRGLEWLYRLVQEPGRLWRRYLVTNSLFLMSLASAMVRRRSTGRRTASSPAAPRT
jgi:exopolysaccharide biosynthesis WecB/TagA/CpsF family protein